MLLSPLLAVLAAIANATASVLQRKAARDQADSETLTWRLIVHLLQRPVWFAGVLSVIAGFLLQAVALGYGQLSVVEPILIVELPATLLIAALVFHSRLGRREWGTSLVMTAGLAGVLFFLAPSSGTSTGVTGLAWALGVGINVGVVALAVAWGRLAATGAPQAAVLGVATGCGFGLTAALIKGVTEVFAHGFTAVFTSWQFYAMIAAGAGSMFLLQSALNSGRLLAAQPGFTLSDPVVSVAWGVFVFDEKIRTGLYLILAGVCAVLVGAATIVLARSPLLSGESGRSDTDTAS
jgi:drug/metabolite transporter (DMT)-like permease